MPAANVDGASATVRTVTGPAARAFLTKARTSLSVRASSTTFTTTVLAAGSTAQLATPAGASRRSRLDLALFSCRSVCSTVRTAAPDSRRVRTVVASASGVTATVSSPLRASNQEPP